MSALARVLAMVLAVAGQGQSQGVEDRDVTRTEQEMGDDESKYWESMGLYICVFVGSTK